MISKDPAFVNVVAEVSSFDKGTCLKFMAEEPIWKQLEGRGQVTVTEKQVSNGLFSKTTACEVKPTPQSRDRLRINAEWGPIYVPAGTRIVKQVTGIQFHENLAQVEFTYETKLNADGALVSKHIPTYPGRAMFTRFDDGWRLSGTSFAGY